MIMDDETAKIEEDVTVENAVEEPKKDVEAKVKAKKKVKKTTKKVKKKASKVAEIDNAGESKIAASKDEGGVPQEIIYGAVIVLAILAIIFYTTNTADVDSTITTTTLAQAIIKNPDIVEISDIVQIEYIGSFENGSVFDTSIEEVAKENGIYTNLREYQPLIFSIGDAGLIRGFENAILGMKIGEDKEVTISPDEAYGDYQSQLIQIVPTKQRSSATQNVSREKFTEEIGQEPYEGLVFQIPESADFEINWPLKVLALYDDIVTFKYMADDEVIDITTVFGPAKVYGDGEDIVIEVQSEKGAKILTRDGPAQVIDVNEENITLDFNHPLAGKKLNFWIKVVDMTKQ